MIRRPGGKLPLSRGSRSFTLVELLVTLAIFAILLGILLSMTSSLLSSWQDGQARNERRTIAQSALDRMARDLNEAALPMARTVTNGLELVINPAGIGTAFECPQAIFWQAPVPTDGGTNGNMAVVGYFVQWVTSSGTPGVPCLSRVLINPSASSYAVYSSPNAWITSPLLQQYAPANAANNYDGLMAANVLGLWVQALDPNGNPIQQGISPALNGEAFDSRYPYAFTNTALAGSPLQTNVACSLPASIQVAIAVIDSHTATHLTAIPTYALTGNFWGDVQSFYNGLPPLIKKGTEIQTRTIPLCNGPR